MSNCQYLTTKEIYERYCISNSTLYGWIKQGIFPKPYKLGPKLSRWKLSELEEWEEQGRDKNQGIDDEK